jgi:hypothetical protein
MSEKIKQIGWGRGETWFKRENTCLVSARPRVQNSNTIRTKKVIPMIISFGICTFLKFFFSYITGFQA